MDQHTFLELVVLGAAIALSGYIGYAIGWEKGRTAFSAWWVETQQVAGKPESTVYFGEDTCTTGWTPPSEREWVYNSTRYDSVENPHDRS